MCLNLAQKIYQTLVNLNIVAHFPQKQKNEMSDRDGFDLKKQIGHFLAGVQTFR